ncbi:MAG: chromate transporter [Peptococcaceae bacterium]|nr:chromate transporter [Peptococcaceae bacterium]
MGIYIDLFFTFFRIGGLTFGGGYTVLPMLQKEIVENRGWATQEEVLDYYAVGQCLPGMIAVNTAIMIGYNVRKRLGALVSALGLVMPSLIVILIVASVLNNFADLPVVQSAFAGIRVAVCALVVNAVYKMGKAGVIDVITGLFCLVTFAASALWGLSPVLLVVTAALLGLIVKKTAAAKSAATDKGGEAK